MNKLTKMLFAASLIAATPAVADVGMVYEEGMKEVDEIYYVETSQPGIVLSGYVDVGYTYNFTGGGSNAIGNRLYFNDIRDGGDFDLNAVKIALEKALSDENEFQAGFRVDLKYGEDANTIGNNPGAQTNGISDSISVDQAYVVVRLPFGNGIDVTFGKWAALLGYEVDDRPANLNITYGADYAYITTQQIGVKADYAFNDIFSGTLAVSNPTGQDDFGGIAGANDGYAIQAALNITNPGGNANIYNAIYYEFAGGGNYISDNEPVFVWNQWGQWEPVAFDGKLLLAYSTYLGFVDDVNVANDNTTFFVTSLYAKYQFTDIFSLAGRGTYAHGDDANVLGGAAIAPNADFWSVTLTAGFDLTENLLVRAEYRVDFGNDIVGTTGNATRDAAHLASFQAVYSF